MPLNKNPIYNLKAVLHETGLKPDVLRAWERRYGVPAPERTQGGHRLYSEYDVALLKWLIVRQNEGMSISRAVEMFREQTAQGKSPLLESAPIKTAPSGFLQQAIYYPPETTLDAIRSHWLAACLNYNEAAAEQALNQAFGLYPVESVCMEVLQRGLSEMGMLWYEGRSSVQQEHFASALAMRRLEALMASSPAPTRAQNILVACPPGEWHAFTLLMISLLLRRRGLNVIYLGANVPADRFVETVAAANAHLVVLAAQQLITAASLQQAASGLAAHGINVAFGGRIFGLQPELIKRIPGFYLGDRLETVTEKVEHHLHIQPDIPEALPPSNEEHETLRSFLAMRLRIEEFVKNDLSQASGEVPEYLENANRFMGDNIIASLQLGNVEYISSEIDWLRQMFKGHQLPMEKIQRFLRVYASAMQEHLDEHAGPLVNWINARLENA